MTIIINHNLQSYSRMSSFTPRAIVDAIGDTSSNHGIELKYSDYDGKEYFTHLDNMAGVYRAVFECLAIVHENNRLQSATIVIDERVHVMALRCEAGISIVFQVELPNGEIIDTESIAMFSNLI